MTARLDPRIVACPQCGASVGAFCLGKAQQVVDYHRLRRQQARLALDQDEARTAAAAPGAGSTITVGADGETEVTAAEVAPAISKEELARRLLVVRALKARVAELESELKETAEGLWRIGDNVSGYLDDDDAAEGRTLGRVGMSRPSKTWRVTDVEKLTAWVQEHAPTEIDTKPVIRNSFLVNLTNVCKQHGGWLTEDGEVIDLPGMELRTGDPSVSITVSKEAGDLVADAMASGRLRADGTLAIEAGS